MVDFNVIATKLYQMTKKAQKCNFNKLQKVDHKNYMRKPKLNNNCQYLAKFRILELFSHNCRQSLVCNKTVGKSKRMSNHPF